MPVTPLDEHCWAIDTPASTYVIRVEVDPATGEAAPAQKYWGPRLSTEAARQVAAAREPRRHVTSFSTPSEAEELLPVDGGTRWGPPSLQVSFGHARSVELRFAGASEHDEGGGAAAAGPRAGRRPPPVRGGAVHPGPRGHRRHRAVDHRAAPAGPGGRADHRDPARLRQLVRPRPGRLPLQRRLRRLGGGVPAPAGAAARRRAGLHQPPRHHQPPGQPVDHDRRAAAPARSTARCGASRWPGAAAGGSPPQRRPDGRRARDRPASATTACAGRSPRARS